MTPLRIISLVPSQTELLYDLGLNEEVVGITKFCIHPEVWYKTKNKIGGTKNIKLQKIISLQPTLILANKEENVKEQIEELKNHFPVYVSDINNMNDALQMIEQVATLTNTLQKGSEIIEKINEEKNNYFIPFQHPKRALYFIWRNPYMVAGVDTFIHEMLGIAGFKNSISTIRYPIINAIEIKQINPEIIFLSSEPYPFNEKHIMELQEIVPQSKIILVDGEMFSWYGSKMLQSFLYFSKLNEQILSL